MGLIIFFLVGFFIVLFFGLNVIRPIIEKSSFPEKTIKDFLKLKNDYIIDYEICKRENFPLYNKKLNFKNILPSVFEPYYFFYYKLIIKNEVYWLEFKKSSSFFHKSKYKIYSNSLKLLVDGLV